MYRLFFPVVVSWLIGLGSPVLLKAQDAPPLSTQQRQAINRIKSLIDKAEKLYTAKRLPDCRDTIVEARELLQSVVKQPTAELLAAVRPQHNRLDRAHQLLRDNGQEIDQLEELPQPAATADNVSFTLHVAPLLMDKCGSCHVNRSRGDFNMANYQALARSTMVEAGEPDGSRLIEVIASGEMPQGDRTVAESELAILENWIAAGAPFDGDDPSTSLQSYARDSNPDRPQLKVTTATGNESVSYALQIAPILIENCSGCHITDRNPRANFDLSNFRGLLRGGDNGNAIVPGDGAASLLVRKLHGTADGQRMPLNRPAIDDEQIELISNWIDEGARFDGRNDRMDLSQVAALARVENMDHAARADHRVQTSLDIWKLVMPDSQPNQLESTNFLLLGTADPEQLVQLRDLAEAAVAPIQAALRLPQQRPLIKGRMTLFAFSRRYDYNEFGRMVESRDLPSQLRSHWGHDTINAFGVLLIDPRKTVDQEVPRSVLIQRLAAAATQDLSYQVPRWFADGLGFRIAAGIAKDDVSKGWSDQASAAAKQMRQPDDFLNERLPENQAGLVGYLFIDALHNNRKAFRTLIENLGNGTGFEQAFNQAYSASPSDLINAWFGKNSNGNRPRPNR